MTNNIIHVMLDLETWGKRPGCDIRSIGACVFDPYIGMLARDHPASPYPDFYIACDNPILWTEPSPRGYVEVYKYPLTRDPSTVKWWNDQSEEARAAFDNPVDLRETLCRFTEWLNIVTRGLRPVDDPRPLHECDVLRLWSHGPAFDVPILAAAYDAAALPVPWHYRAPRDTRTLFDIAGIDDHSAFMTQFNYGTAHNALDDAISQALAVCAAWETVERAHIAKLRPCPFCGGARPFADPEEAGPASAARAEPKSAAEQALRPFAELGERVLSEAPPDAEAWSFKSCTGETFSVRLDDFRAAIAALGGTDNG